MNDEHQLDATIERLLRETPEVEDNGFTARVMQSLPPKRAAFAFRWSFGSTAIVLGAMALPVALTEAAKTFQALSISTQGETLALLACLAVGAYAALSALGVDLLDELEFALTA